MEQKKKYEKGDKVYGKAHGKEPLIKWTWDTLDVDKYIFAKWMKPLMQAAASSPLPQHRFQSPDWRQEPPVTVQPCCDWSASQHLLVSHWRVWESTSRRRGWMLWCSKTFGSPPHLPSNSSMQGSTSEAHPRLSATLSRGRLLFVRSVFAECWGWNLRIYLDTCAWKVLTAWPHCCVPQL